MRTTGSSARRLHAARCCEVCLLRVGVHRWRQHVTRRAPHARIRVEDVRSHEEAPCRLRQARHDGLVVGRLRVVVAALAGVAGGNRLLAFDYVQRVAVQASGLALLGVLGLQVLLVLLVVLAPLEVVTLLRRLVDEEGIVQVGVGVVLVDRVLGVPRSAAAPSGR